MKKVSTPTQTHTTLYSRDAQDNVFATYDFIPWMTIDGPKLDKPNEMMIYGSSRLGVKRPLQQRANSITNHATESLSVSSGFFPKPFAEVQAEVCGNSGPETYVEPALDYTDVNYFRKHINESSTYLVSTVFGNPPMSYLYPEFTCSKNLTHTRLFTGMSEYELSNHLGNAESPESLRFGILSTVKDEPILTPEASLSPSNEVAFTKKPLILTAQDYYPFGMPMPNRSFSLGGRNYRFGFNTQEKNDEVYGKGNLMTAKYWEMDARIGRRWNRDPVLKEWESPYLVNSGNPIWNTDPDGDDDFVLQKNGSLTKIEDKGSTSDRLIALDAAGRIMNEDKTYKHLVFEKGLLSRSESDGNGTMFTIENNRTISKKVFNFLADYSDVEFSLIDIDEKLSFNGEIIKNSYITTSHESDKERKGSIFIDETIKYDEEKQYKIFKHEHNHPRDRSELEQMQPNDFGKPSSKDGDIGVYEKIKSHSPNAEFKIREEKMDYDVIIE